MSYYRVEHYRDRDEPPHVATSAVGHYRAGLPAGWTVSGEYLSRDEAERHGRAIVADGYEARVVRIAC